MFAAFWRNKFEIYRALWQGRISERRAEGVASPVAWREEI